MEIQTFPSITEAGWDAVISEILPRLSGQGIVFLHGPLGAGKTTFIRKLLEHLGVNDRIKSPTFSLLEPYTLPDHRMVFHYDLYRLNPREFQEIEALGFRDQLQEDALLLIEWPDRLDGRVCPTMEVWIEMGPAETRKVRIQFA